ncbi:MAG: histidinol-phosphatase HisJ family protein [Thermoleophilaceae bacterium]|jgi:histidinol-phosphatase (PHP family)|nr:histidinol-phosphatase HisJ family protein [Thermoleophilaceae bacterium]
MLTDLHVHLRPDDPEAGAEESFTRANAERYAEVASERGIGFLGVSEHLHRFRQALDVWRHPFWEQTAVDDLDSYCEFVRTETDLALGIEADFVPGREDRIANLLEERDWDYVLGSVHFLGDASVDMAGEWDVWRTASDPEQVWRRYFETLGEAARSGLFDVLSHPDLVKVWGAERPRPARDPRFLYELAMDGLAGSDVAVEVSTAGLRKAAGEIYPAPELLAMCLEAGRPVTLSSDAHTPNDLAYRYEEAVELLASLGVEEIAVFERRERRLVPLG